MRIRFIILFLVFFISGLLARVESVYFETDENIPLFRPPANLQKEYELFQKSLPFIGEGFLVLTVLNFGNDTARISTKQQNELTSRLGKIYLSIGEDPDFENISHSLSYSYNSTAINKGHYFIYKPENITERTDCKIFLHGFGGNFLYYIWLMKNEYPNSVIIAPTFSYSWRNGTVSYFNDVIDDVKKSLSIEINETWLFAISDGGPAGFNIYNEYADFIKGYICIASGPFNFSPNIFKDKLNVLMINGTNDSRVKIENIRKIVSRLEPTIKNLEYHELDGDHFFMLTQRKKCFDVIDSFIQSD